ncbi:MAG: hypothetical protein IJK02_12320 [Clostridia bacterium]|nr:hypothetical protein [Clostridia bacterium]MBR0510037.1 hypothetical protein [Clostridia bacterium]MBR0537015.1 hypothetical protein [Clostridia bacterium]
MSSYTNADELYFSKIFNSGVYTYNGEMLSALPLPDPFTDQHEVPLLENILTHEKYFLKKIKLYQSVNTINEYRDKILYPCVGFASWPADLVELKEETRVSAAVRHYYLEDEQGAVLIPSDHALLFRYDPASGTGGYPPCMTLDVWMRGASGGENNYRNPNIRKVAVNLTRAIQKVNAYNYHFHDFHLSRFMVGSRLDVHPDFSPLLALNGNVRFDVSYGWMPLEFADPYIAINNVTSGSGIKKLHQPDVHSQNFSLASLLFFLLFGRKPYDGHQLMGREDDVNNRFTHYDYMVNYYLKESNIEFIFDPSENNRNRITTDVTDMFGATIELWEAAPEALRDLFLLTFKTSNALRRREPVTPDPEQWLQCFSDIGWMDE